MHQAAAPELDLKWSCKAVNGFLDHYLSLKVWHQHTGTIRNGKLTVTVSGEHLKGNNKEEVWSFDSWPPNESEAKTFDSFILDTMDPEKLKLTVRIDVTSADTKPFSYSTPITWTSPK
jgi:hypothetical protein